MGDVNLVDYYAPEVNSYSDYYAFGQAMPGRTFVGSTNYRYNYQNQERDPELWDGAISFKYRIEDQRLGRFFSVDPLAAKYASESPYSFAHNKVNFGNELEGLEIIEGVYHWNKLCLDWLGYGDSYGAQLNQAMYNQFSIEGRVNQVTTAYETAAENPVAYYFTDVDPIGSSLNKTYDLYQTVKGVSQGNPQAIMQTIDYGLLIYGIVKFNTPGGKPLTGTWVGENTKGWSANAIAYQEYATGVKVGRAFDVNGVKFDGFKNGKLIEAKSSYDNFVNSSGQFYDWFNGKDALVNQARNQLKAADGTSVEWHFKTQKSLDATKILFQENGIEGIDLIYDPPPTQ